MLLTSEQLKSKPSLPTEDIDVPEFGGTVRLRAWTGEEYDQFAEAIAALKFDGAMYAAAVAVAAVNESGEKVYDVKADAPHIVSTWSKTTLEAAYGVIRRMNRLGKEGVDESLKN